MDMKYAYMYIGPDYIRHQLLVTFILAQAEIFANILFVEHNFGIFPWTLKVKMTLVN